MLVIMAVLFGVWARWDWQALASAGVPRWRRPWRRMS